MLPDRFIYKPAEMPDLFISADSKCGLGHVRRQQVLESQWKKMGGNVYWSLPTHFNGIVSVDDYYFSDFDRELMMDDGNLVVYFTEFEGDFHADLIVNQNIGAEELVYPNAKYICAGTRYFQLRDSIMSLQISGNEKVFDAIKVNRSMSPDAFASALASAKAVICGSGLTAYESIYLQKPTFLTAMSEGEKRTYQKLIEGGWAFAYTPEVQQKLDYGWLPVIKNGRELINGKGADRVANRILFEWKVKEHAKTQKDA